MNMQNSLEPLTQDKEIRVADWSQPYKIAIFAIGLVVGIVTSYVLIQKMSSIEGYLQIIAGNSIQK